LTLKCKSEILTSKDVTNAFRVNGGMMSYCKKIRKMKQVFKGPRSLSGGWREVVLWLWA
jgi:hypothetical protein